VNDEIIEVAAFGMFHGAELAATALRAAGVECVLPDRYGRGRKPAGAFTGQMFRILIHATDRDRALAILGGAAQTAP
jgi:hypothetical protein